MQREFKSGALIFIFITILLDVIGLGIIIPVFPALIMELTGEGLSAASKYGGLLMFSYAIMQFLFAPVMGMLSDKFGRRPVLLAALTGFGLDYLLQGFAPTLGWLFIGRILAGITGASFTTATAYIADISPGSVISSRSSTPVSLSRSNSLENFGSKNSSNSKLTTLVEEDPNDLTPISSPDCRHK